MLPHRNHQHAFAYLARLRLLDHRTHGPGFPSQIKCKQHQRRYGSDKRQPPRFQESCPPLRLPILEPQSDLLPYPPLKLLSWFRHGRSTHRRIHLLDLFHLRPALRTLPQMRCNRFAFLGLAIPVGNQFFFRSVFHPSVPIARAFPSRKGSSARRNFCTARKTVFLVAFEFDFSTLAISSIPQPSQCRMTIAVLSAGLSVSSAARIFSASCPLSASRSGE